MAPTSATSPTAGEIAGDSNEKPLDPKQDKASKETAETVDKPDTVRVEFVGVPPYGREFHGRREIDSAAWDRVGVNHTKVVWEKDKGWFATVPSDNEALLEYLRVPSNGFKVHED